MRARGHAREADAFLREALTSSALREALKSSATFTTHTRRFTGASTTAGTNTGTGTRSRRASLPTPPAVTLDIPAQTAAKSALAAERIS